MGKVGVSIGSLADMEELFQGIPLGKVSTIMTINATAPILLALYEEAARKQGVPTDRIAGTVQNDLLKEFGARGAWSSWSPCTGGDPKVAGSGVLPATSAVG